MEINNEAGRDNSQTSQLAEDENNNSFRFGIEPLPLDDVLKEEAQTREINKTNIEQKDKSSSEDSSDDETTSMVLKNIKGSSNNIAWKDKSLFKCNHCYYCTNKWHILLEHLKTEHKNCKDNEINSKKTNLKVESYENVDSDEPLVTVMKGLNKKDNEDGDEPQIIFTCSECPYNTNIRYYLTRHARTHSGVKPHKCKICDRGFGSVYALQNHIKVHYGEKNNICKFCETAFTTPAEMNRHIKYKHTKVKPHKCTECDYAAVERYKLQRHMRCHTGERPYQCQHCSFASYDLFKLNQHRRTHEKPYKCNKSITSFVNSSSLKDDKLVKNNSLETKMYSCELCPVKTTRKSDLRQHITRIHLPNKHLKCAGCGETFSDRYSYKLHLKMIQRECHFKCQLCSFTAKRFDYLGKHMILHKEVKPSEVDESCFSYRLLRNHNKMYVLKKIHRCSVCKQSYPSKTALEQHKKEHTKTQE